MAADLHLFGHKVKPVTAGAIAVGSAAAIYLAVRQHKAASSSPSASSIDPVTGLPFSQDNQTDPLTGQSYLAEAQEYGSVQAAENAVAGESSIDYSSAGVTGSGVAGTSATALQPATTVGGTTYASNAAWAQAVEAGLTDIGYSATDVAAAIGRYLGGLSLTAAQATIVQDALAEYGPPPTGSFQVILAPPTTGTGSGPSGTGSGSGSGGTAKGGPITVTPVGLHTTQVSAASAGVAWTAPTIPAGQGPLTGYTLQVFNADGTPEGTPWTVPPTQLYGNAGGLKPKTAYHINVWCDPAKTGGPHATVSFTTT